MLGVLEYYSMLKGDFREVLRRSLGILLRDGVRGLYLRHRVRQRSRRSVSTYDGLPNSNTNDFINFIAPSRQVALLSDWHRSLVGYREDPMRPAPAKITLGLCLVTHNSRPWLRGFFDSLHRQSFPLSRLNVVIVDNGSTDGTRSFLEEYRRNEGARYGSFDLHESENRGFGASQDFAIRQCRDDFVVVSNVDIEFHEHTLSRLLSAAIADELDIGCWEVRQCPFEHPKFYDPVTLETSWSSHACILLRRSAYEQVGGYEKRIFMYGEDVELSYRLRGNGWRLRYLPQVTVTHFVDFEDTGRRPHQLTGSLSANVLLRYRYGGTARGEEGELLLLRAAANESDPSRKSAFSEARKIVGRNRTYFRIQKRPRRPVPFPFNGFDYDLVRTGHDIELQSAIPLRETPLVSIITRTHGEKTNYLKEAIASVINQTYENIEHIIVEDRTELAAPLVNDASNAYKRNIRYLRSDGVGRSAAGNCGLAAARGDLIMFLDNDDLLFADHVEALVRALSTNPAAMAAYALAWDVETKPNSDGSYRETLHSLHPGHCLDFSAERLRVTNFIPIQCLLFRRALYDSEGGFDEEIDHLEDWNLWVRYSRLGEFLMVPKVTSLYRTPADEDLRAQRQAQLDQAYDTVRARNEKMIERYIAT